MTRQEQLTLAAAKLARSDPTLWHDFLKELDALRKATTDNLVSSPEHELKRFQGRAQILKELCDELKKCVETADAIARKAPK